MTEEKSQYSAPPDFIPHQYPPREYGRLFRAKFIGQCCLCWRHWPVGALVVILKERVIATLEYRGGIERDYYFKYAHKACADGKPEQAEIVPEDQSKQKGDHQHEPPETGKGNRQ